MLLATIVLLAMAPLSTFGFAGMLTTSSGGLTGTGTWASDFRISWQVEQLDNNAWLYQYRLTGLNNEELRKAVSHFTVEISPNVPQSRFWGFSHDYDDVEFGSFEGITTAMKLDWEATNYSFYSWQAPVWGDFYAKGGRDARTDTELAMWNAGFGSADPTAAAADGSIGNKILRPDTYSSVPEPGTMLLFGIGLMGATIRKRFLK